MKYTEDNSFDKAYKVTCTKHNTRQLFFKKCSDCIIDDKIKKIKEFINSNISLEEMSDKIMMIQVIV